MTRTKGTLLPEWGWRMKCRVCSAELTEWQQAEADPYAYRTGPPELPRGRGNMDHGGWFIYRPGPGTHGPHYVAYCPEHAAEAIAWKRELVDWNAQRSGIGKSVYLGWIDRLKALVGIGIPGPRARKETTKAMGEWVDANPKPAPPWQKACYTPVTGMS